MGRTNIFNKIWGVLNSFWNRFNNERKLNKRAKATFTLKQNKISDFKRWKNSEELHKNWDARTKIIGGMIKPHAHIIEFGAGNKSLIEFLPENCTYQSSDIFKRFPDTLVCDLNKKVNFSLEPYDTAVFSGVLEYVYDVEMLFEQLKDIEIIILSYSCRDVSQVNRLKQGWLSDYSQVELEDIFKKNGYKIEEYKEWNKQSIYKLVK